MSVFNIEFLPEKVTVPCLPGDTILDAARRAGLHLPSLCGGAGVCAKCRVQIIRGSVAPSKADLEFLSEKEIHAGIRLACRAEITSDCVIDILTQNSSFILTHGSRPAVIPQSAVQKKYVTIPRPASGKNSSDYENLLCSFQSIDHGTESHPDLLQVLPLKLRQYNFQGTIVSHLGRVIDFQSGDTSSRLYGMAVDLGTTTVVGKLLDLCSGSTLSVFAHLNEQRFFGEDVISRISYSMEKDIRFLQEAAVKTINEIVSGCVQQSGIDRQDIYEMTVSGNTVMLHFLLGITPRYLAEFPYMPVFRAPMYRSSRDLGISIHEHGSVYTLPVIGRFVGGDTAALVLTLQDQMQKTWLAVDIGTNGEIVLCHKGKCVSTSTAAGPAFEGARIRFGMRAMSGAIDHVFMKNNKIRWHVINEAAVQGICGSGLIDLTAVLLQTGLISETGRLNSDLENTTFISGDFLTNIKFENDKPVFVFEPQAKDPRVMITQQDIREIQLAKAAVAAGIEILLKHMNLKAEDLEAVYLAGAFGQYIVKESAMAIGLLPSMPVEKIHFIGNAACAGAEMALVSLPQRGIVEKLAHSMEYIDISAHPQFQDIFADKMLFTNVTAETRL